MNEIMNTVTTLSPFIAGAFGFVSIGLGCDLKSVKNELKSAHSRNSNSFSSQRKLKKLNSELECVIKTNKTKHDELLSKYNMLVGLNLTEENKKLNDISLELENKLSGYVDEIEDLKISKSKAFKNLEDRCNKLKREVGIKSNTIDNLNSEIVYLKKCETTYQSTLSDKNKKHSKNHNKITDLNNKISIAEKVKQEQHNNILNLKEEIKQIKIDYDKMLKVNMIIDEKIVELDKIKNKNEIYKKIIMNNLHPDFSEDVVNMIDDYVNLKLNGFSDWFENKKSPSLKSSDILKGIKSDYKEILNENLKLKALCSASEEVSNIDSDSFKEKSSSWVDNWDELSIEERNQIKLNNFNNKHKSKSEIGAEYERFCGYLFEKDNEIVEYRGIKEGFGDGGLDLISKPFKSKIVKYIQCKYWSEDKLIRENTVTQLYGSSLCKYLQDNKNKTSVDFVEAVNKGLVEMILITKTKFSDEAKEFSKSLNVKYMENIRIVDYPQIKGVSGKEDIYYIPTDQKYDDIKYMSTNKKYIRFKTTKDAFESGFRHAYRWKGVEQ